MISQTSLRDLQPFLRALERPSSFGSALRMSPKYIFNPIVTIALTALAVGTYCNPCATLGFVAGFICSPLAQNKLHSRAEEVAYEMKRDSLENLLNSLENLLNGFTVLPAGFVRRVSNLWNAFPSHGKIALKTVALISVTALMTFSVFYSAYHFYVLSGIAIGLIARRFFIPESSEEKIKQLQLACKVVAADNLKRAHLITHAGERIDINLECRTNVLQQLKTLFEDEEKTHT